MVNSLKIKKQDLGLLVFLLLVTALLVTKGNLTGFSIAGAITSSTELRWSNGSTATLLYDNNSQTYGDSSLVNDNMYLHLCADNANELLNNYTKLVYRMQTYEIDLTVLPAQITSGSITGNCADIDLDLSTFSAYYPGIVTVALDSSPSFSSPIYYPLTQTTGFLSGNYTVSFQQVGSNLEINISSIVDDQNRTISTDLPFLILGIKNSTGGLIYANITQPSTLIQIPYPSDSNFTFVVNNFDVPSQNLDAPEICTNNLDDDYDSLIDCADPECAADPSCQPPSSGGGGGGGTSYCQQKWICGEWLNCQPDSTQIRECIDANDCLNRSQIRFTRLVTNPKPDETQSCTYSPQCNDNIINQDETDFDCGGIICSGCEISEHCLKDNDCLSQNCFKEVCRPEGFQCLEDIDCPSGFTCEEFECLLFKVFRKPDKVSPLEKYILWTLLALILISSSFIAYVRYKKSPLHEKTVKTKEKQSLEKYSQILGDFIKQANLKGYTKQEIKKSLKEKGWPANITDKYLGKVYQKPPKPQIQKSTLKQEIKDYEEKLKKLK